MIRIDCIPSRLIDTIEEIGGADNIVEIVTNKSQNRALLCALTNTDYDNKPETFTIFFQGTDEQEEANARAMKSLKNLKKDILFKKN